MASKPSVTLYFSPARLPVMITRLTTYLLEHQYGFLQTHYTPSHTEFKVFDAQEQPVLRLTLKGTHEPAVRSTDQALSVSRQLTSDVVHLLHHLLQIDV